MSEQAACTELAQQASQDQSGGTLDGESLLLPLLQGLLDAPESEPNPDSGTESGEEHRNNLIAEVQAALEKLSTSLRTDITTDIHPERRSSLLQLVNKLQIGLSTATCERRHSSAPRFRRDRNRERPNRHTVGVSEEELADARRLIEEISSPSHSYSNIPKQNSESSVTPSTPTMPKPLVKNTTPKPYSNSNSTSVSNASSSVHTPSESLDYLEPLFTENSENIPQVETEEVNEKPEKDSSTEEDSTVKPENKNANLILQHNPLYLDPNKFSNESPDDKIGRFVSKKLKIKRANTIDIPKPFNFNYDDGNDYEDDGTRRRSAYFALRGPIRVGNPIRKSIVPSLEPKTENDKKFLAFINKHNEENGRQSIWTNSDNNKTSIWSNKFDNIKTNFEKHSTPSNRFTNNAKNYWKTADNSNNQPGKFRKIFEEQQNQKNISNYEPVPEKNYKFIPQPLPINKFSHAPSSAFQPIIKEPSTPKYEHSKIKFKPQPLEIHNTVTVEKESDHPKSMYDYSPKRIPQKNPTSPGFVKPWMANTGESRVLSIASSKFENPATTQSFSFQPKKINKDMIKTFSKFEQPVEKLTAPYLVKTMKKPTSNVRKISGQYDNLGVQNQQNIKTRHNTPNRSHIEGFQARFTVPQNYSIRYDTPTANSPKPQEINNFAGTQLKESGKHLHEYISNKAAETFKEYLVDNPKKQVPSSLQWQEQPAHTQQYHHQQNAEETQKQNNYSKVNQIPKQDYLEPNYQQNRNSGIISPSYQAQSQIKTEIFPPAPKPKYDSQTSVESLKEYGAINSQVMTGPVQYQASTVRQKSPMTRNEHDMEAAFALRNVLQKVSPAVSPHPNPISNNVNFSNRPLKSPVNTRREEKVNYSNSNESARPMSLESCELTDKGESIVTSRFHIPAISVKSPEIRQFPREIKSIPTHSQILSKSDSWHQICAQNQTPQHKPSPRSSPISRTVMKSKSSHSLLIPKQYEAGMTKEEMNQKKKTMEAFFSGGSNQVKSKLQDEGKVIKRSINRTKTSEKNIQYRSSVPASLPLSRSRTLPDIVSQPEMLDESNVDEAFEELYTCC